ncbi:putative autotransporter protein [Janthinobacterium sp. CG23_2]|nr:putative autotransporter protein [Janthinobacterium sp. CG23_2]CUU27925.1 putative autotransporter protein [Janthinobacterium sp. CG23_2]
MANFNFQKKQMATLVAGACLVMANASAIGTACPVASGGIITVDNTTIDNVCTIGPGESLNVTATGVITVPLANTPNNGVEVNTGVTAGSITNAGTINPVAVGINITGNLTGGIINTGTISSTGPWGGVTEEAIRLSGASVGGAISNGPAGVISTVNGSAIHIINSTLQGGITNAAGGNISAAGGFAAVDISGSQIGVSIVNQGHIGRTPGQNARGIALSSVAVTGDILNSGTIDTQGGYPGLALTATTVSGKISNSGTLGSSNSDAFTILGNSTVGQIENTATGTINGSSKGIYGSTSTITSGIVNAGTISAMHPIELQLTNISGGGILIRYRRADAWRARHRPERGADQRRHHQPRPHGRGRRRRHRPQWQHDHRQREQLRHHHHHPVERPLQRGRRRHIHRQRFACYWRDPQQLDHDQ